MCCVNRMQTRLFRITASELLRNSLCHQLMSIFFQRQFCWAGHVMCMPWDRFPRKMISSWVCSKRPKGYYPNLVYGRSLKKTLNKTDVDTENWHVLFLDRDEWRDIINDIPLVYE